MLSKINFKKIRTLLIFLENYFYFCSRLASPRPGFQGLRFWKQDAGLGGQT